MSSESRRNVRPAIVPNPMAGSQATASTVLTIGNFDGVHRGHAALLDCARAKAGAQGQVIALYFDPHPISVLRPGAEPARLTTSEQRGEYLRDLGADVVERLEPTTQFLAQSPEEFVEWLVRTYAPTAIVEGADFRFGRGRVGSVATLRQAGVEHGFDVIVADPIEVELSDQSAVRASSSLVRWLISHGRVRDARLVLGRCYELLGKVTQGDQRGRTLGVPTANLGFAEGGSRGGGLLLPADGIYAGFATSPDGALHAAAISIGTKPTFGEHPRSCEVHLLDYDGRLDAYGWQMRVKFSHWVRDQLHFDSVEPLIEQIRRDIAWTRQLCDLSHGVENVC